MKPLNNNVTPPNFPLRPFRDWIQRTIGVSDAYKEYSDTFLRRDVQDMYLGAKWVWSCMTRNFDKRIDRLANEELDRTLRTLGRTREEYVPTQLKQLLDVKRQHLASNHSKVLEQIFLAQIFDNDETEFRTNVDASSGVRKLSYMEMKKRNGILDEDDMPLYVDHRINNMCASLNKEALIIPSTPNPNGDLGIYPRRAIKQSIFQTLNLDPAKAPQGHRPTLVRKNHSMKILMWVKEQMLAKKEYRLGLAHHSAYIIPEPLSVKPETIRVRFVGGEYKPKET